MKKWLVLTAVLAMPAASAFADEATGTIDAISPDERRVTIDNGMTFAVMPRVDLSQFAVGQRVKLTYTPTTLTFQSLGLHGNAEEVVAVN